MSRMATVKETGVELSEDEWRRFEAGVAAELACRTRPRSPQAHADVIAPDLYARLPDTPPGENLARGHHQP